MPFSSKISISDLKSEPPDSAPLNFPAPCCQTFPPATHFLRCGLGWGLRGASPWISYYTESHFCLSVYNTRSRHQTLPGMHEFFHHHRQRRARGTPQATEV